MPIRRSNLTRSEAAEYRAQLSQLKEMGVLVGDASESTREPDRLTLEQVDHELAELYELPLGEIAVVVFAELTVLRSGSLITDLEMTTPWGDVLDLSDPEECSYYNDLICGWPEFPPKFLNHWLTHHVPLTPRREEGAIIATGRGSVPPECHDQLPVAVKLFLWDQRGNESCFDFQVRVDRIVKNKYERPQRDRREGARLTKRVSLFEREDAEIRDQDGTIQQQVTGPNLPSPVVVSAEKPLEGSSPDAPREDPGEPIGAV